MNISMTITTTIIFAIVIIRIIVPCIMHANPAALAELPLCAALLYFASLVSIVFL